MAEGQLHHKLAIDRAIFDSHFRDPNVQPVTKSYSSLLSLLRLQTDSTDLALIAIDGCGAAGKTTFARKLAQQFRHAQIVPMDDFYQPSADQNIAADNGSPIGSLFDWQRLEQQVLSPLSKGLPGRYQRYDWHAHALAEWQEVPAAGVIIVEGVYSARRELADYYSHIIWIETPAKERLRRGIARDGEKSRGRWEGVWMSAEERYVNDDSPRKRADIVVDGSGATAHELETEFVCWEPR